MDDQDPIVAAAPDKIAGSVVVEWRFANTQAGPEEQRSATVHRQKVGRNDPCPCGSGKKYKKCGGLD
ncbi:SEC-C metal-binding domain-containing protein [Nitrobacter winogradskyi]|uniref:Uncharacterized protein YecA (UPF0149 family) n=2 Tax=Nitrobacter winogradskyi TaxID=913 RepID=A0ACC6AP51_NITWI|nr:SEC-C metal-binding domain-containing protein [Nitrobacter winogradskyi]MCP2001273.1 uncharacterized protein YecA (UPF0149 family) [Nitrobacter winogradskyi]GEC16804.1 hypothetical protein NWI01_26960 [Nitrobacter winogradskyi]